MAWKCSCPARAAITAGAGWGCTGILAAAHVLRAWTRAQTPPTRSGPRWNGCWGRHWRTGSGTGSASSGRYAMRPALTESQPHQARVTLLVLEPPRPVGRHAHLARNRLAARAVLIDAGVVRRRPAATRTGGFANRLFPKFAAHG